MKIRSVRIDSFGGLKDRSFKDIDPKLTVIYGKNEAGKTTLMEFIRGTLFPSTRRKGYPVAAKSDSGSMVLETDSGESMELMREGNKTREADGKPLPEALVHLDSSMYRSIFAMTPEDLRDSEIISSGDIRQRFVIVPGGESIQPVLKGISDEMSEYMGAERRTNKRIHSKISELKAMDERIARSEAVGEKYSELFRERVVLEGELAELNRDAKRYSEYRTRMTVRAAQNENREKLEKLREERKSLSASESVRPGDLETYSTMKSDIQGKKDALSKITDSAKSMKDSFGGMDPAPFSLLENKIRELEGNKGLYSELERNSRDLSERIGKESKKADAIPETSGSAVTALVAIPVIGAVMVLAGLFVNQYISIVGAILAVAGVLAVITDNKRRTARKMMRETSDHIGSDMRSVPERSDLSDMESKLSSMRRELDAIADVVRIPRSSFVSDVNLLSDMSVKAREYSMVSGNLREAERACMDVESQFRGFLSRFGTEEMFLQLVKQSKDRERIDHEISTLEASIRSSEGVLSEDVPEDIPSEDEISSRVADMSRRSGILASEMAAIINDGDTESLLTAKAEGRAELESMVREWGVLSLADKIANRACDGIYSSVRPDVVRSSDRYIGLMTNGRYGLCSDLRESDIAVISNDVKKKEDKWSSGLGDQVKLSLKMAVAKELSSEKLPILLDDVLLMFDSDRKRGACRALMDLSDDMQVLLFTCDAETRDIMMEESAGEMTLISL